MGGRKNAYKGRVLYGMISESKVKGSGARKCEIKGWVDTLLPVAAPCVSCCSLVSVFTAPGKVLPWPKFNIELMKLWNLVGYLKYICGVKGYLWV